MATWVEFATTRSRVERLRAGWQRRARQLRRSLDRLAPRLYLLLAALLLVVSKADLRLVHWLGGVVSDLYAPALSVLQQPVRLTRSIGEEVGALLALRSENARLRAELAELRHWREEAVRLEVENRALRRMLAMPVVPGTARQTVARVVGDSGGPFRHARLLDAGADRGITAGMPVMDEHGLVGRVLEAGRRSARILLLTDLNSRIPVVVAPSGDHAILEGDNSRRPRLGFLPLDPSLAPGDRVVTSGRDGLLPLGLPVGEIEEVSEHAVTVRPFADWDRLDYVVVLQYAPVRPPEKDEAFEASPAPAGTAPPGTDAGGPAP